jgi:hypothetical protein
MSDMPRVRSATPFGVGAGSAGGAGSLQAPVLTSPSAGTPTSDGATSAGVTTDQGSGRLYWAVVTNGGSATNAQIIAASGGNIVAAAGAKGNQVVNAKGAQTIATITGLTTATTYQILYLHVNALSQESNQASVSLTTA